jgi:flavin reductase (DIM6/NTAB) family NADH-FMN oxidoreductase RutF
MTSVSQTAASTAASNLASADAPPAIDPALFRSVLSRFASGVTVITSRDANGTDYGMTVSAFSSLSLDPPLVLVCIDESATWHAVLPEAVHFNVHVLGIEQEAISRRFAGDRADRFADVSHARGENGVIQLHGVLALLECRITARHAGGDHTIVVGEVERAHADDGDPLVYFRGGYQRLAR